MFRPFRPADSPSPIFRDDPLKTGEVIIEQFLNRQLLPLFYLLPVDLDQRSSWQKALPVAVKMCQDNGANLHVLCVVPDFGMSIVSQYFPQDQRQEAMDRVMRELKSFVADKVPDDVAVRHILGEGTVYDVILKIANDVDADLIVMASQRPELQDYLLGPNAARVVRHANCSVTIVRGD